MNVTDIIAKLNLLPHPEGGYYRETYRSDEQIGVHDRYGEGVKRHSLSAMEAEGQGG